LSEIIAGISDHEYLASEPFIRVSDADIKATSEFGPSCRGCRRFHVWTSVEKRILLADLADDLAVGAMGGVSIVGVVAPKLSASGA
jgi:hypothetical protein